MLLYHTRMKIHTNNGDCMACIIASYLYINLYIFLLLLDVNLYPIYDVTKFIISLFLYYGCFCMCKKTTLLNVIFTIILTYFNLYAGNSLTLYFLCMYYIVFEAYAKTLRYYHL